MLHVRTSVRHRSIGKPILPSRFRATLPAGSRAKSVCVSRMAAMRLSHGWISASPARISAQDLPPDPTLVLLSKFF